MYNTSLKDDDNLNTLETKIKNVVAAQNINDLRKIAILNSIKNNIAMLNTSTSTSTLTVDDYVHYVYFVLRVYAGLGGPLQELSNYMWELHARPHIRNDINLEMYIRKIVDERKRANHKRAESESESESACSFNQDEIVLNDLHPSEELHISSSEPPAEYLEESPSVDDETLTLLPKTISTKFGRGCTIVLNLFS